MGELQIKKCHSVYFFFSLDIKANPNVLVNAEVQQNQTELFVMEYHLL